MMKAAMRLQKTQLASSFKLTNTSGTFNRDRYLMAGYRTFDLMLVAGGGGVSGEYTTGPADERCYASGGGGGESLRYSGDLEELSALVAYSVGGGGATGTSGSKPGNGGDGVNTIFDAFTAFGGKGGIRGLKYIGVPPQFLGFGGGGDGMSTDGIQGLGGTTAAAPTVGGWNPSLLIGCGGGGGRGYMKYYTEGTYAAQAGTAGASSGAGYTSSGGATVSLRGGCGGGANIAPITGGAAEYYGSYRSGSNPGGVIVLKLS